MDKKEIYIIGGKENISKEVLKKIEETGHIPTFVVDPFHSGSEPTEPYMEQIGSILPKPPKPKGKSKYHK